MSDAKLRVLERAWKASKAPADEAAWLRERVRQGDGSLGRITFPGNPWPAGHRLKSLTWSGRLEDDGVWFDLDLETVNYDADDPPGTEDSFDEDAGDWAARIVWRNYHRCRISSNEGFLVGTAKRKLDLDRLPERELRVDPVKRGQTAADLDHDDLGFHTYLLGHDTVADHRIRFLLREDTDRWWLRWSGKIALTYAGDEDFASRFELPFAPVRFGGIRAPKGLKEPAAREALARFVERPDDLVLRRRGGRAPLRPAYFFAALSSPSRSTTPSMKLFVKKQMQLLVGPGLDPAADVGDRVAGGERRAHVLGEERALHVGPLLVAHHLLVEREGADRRQPGLEVGAGVGRVAVEGPR
jgi:hypothetical protein